MINTINTIFVDKCPLCKGHGSLQYKDLEDRSYKVKGKWSFYKCNSCYNLWLSPITKSNATNNLYAEYYTHLEIQSGESDKNSRDYIFINTIKDLLLPKRRFDIKAAKNMFLEDVKAGRLLDIGSGNGSLLANFKELGWNVMGIEPDTTAANLSRDNYGFEIINDHFENIILPSESFNAITLCHVIEHIESPYELLAKCYALLKPKGLLSIITPNVNSLGHCVFKSNWFGLEPPRHLILYNKRSLDEIITNCGYRIIRTLTLSRWAGGLFNLSINIRNNGRVIDGYKQARYSRLLGMIFIFTEYWTNYLFKDKGEEIGILAEKS